MQFQQKDKYSANSYIRSQHKYLYKSKRKVTPIMSQQIQSVNQSDNIKHISQICEPQCEQKAQILKEINKYCQHRHKGLKTALNQHIQAEIISQQFVFNQFFIPNCDSMYFSKNYMEDILKKCHFESFALSDHTRKSERSLSELKYPKLEEFKGLQQALPKPQLLSKHFIEKERYKMQQNRINIRSRNQTSIQKNIKLLTHHVDVGHQVWAFCPTCLLIHRGTVLSQYKDSYLLNFDEPLFGALKVPEQFITTKLNSLKRVKWSSFEQRKRGSKDRKEREQKIDMQALTIYISLLQMKKQLLIKLTQFNNIAEDKKSQFPTSGWVSFLDQIQIQQYGWIGTCINLITVATRYIENNYSVKLPAQSDNRNLLGRQKCSKNSKLPMLALSDSYCSLNTSANEQYEVNKCQKIKNIEKNKKTALNEEHQYHQQQQDNHDKLDFVNESARLSLGILQNLQKKGKNYRMQEDENYKTLEQKYRNEYAGQIKQVESKLKNIIKKLSD